MTKAERRVMGEGMREIRNHATLYFGDNMEI